MLGAADSEFAGVAACLSKSRALLFVVLALLAPTHPAAGQARARIVDWALKDDAPSQALTRDRYGKTVSTDLAALEIVAISVGGKPVTPGRPFAAGDDWMRDLRVRARNVSPKPMARVSLSFDVPETQAGDHMLAVSLSFGKGTGPCVDGGEPGVAAPGEEFELAMTRPPYEQTRDWIASWTGVTNVTRLDLRSATLVFDDCTPWGGELRPRNARLAPR